MTKEYFDMEDWEFNNTKIHDFRTCPALGYWRWVRRIESIRPNGHLIFGTAVHEGAAVWNRGRMSTQNFVSREEQDLYNATLQRISKEMENMPEVGGSKNLQTAESLVTQTISHPDLQGTITAVEERYEKQLYYDHNSHHNIIYFGKVDLRLIKNDIDYINDYKSTGRLQSNFFDAFFLSNQPRGYCWLTGVRNFIVTVLHAITGKCSYSGEKGPCVHVQDYYYDDREIDRWRREICVTIKHIYSNIIAIENTSAYELFPRFATRCQPPNYGCSYQRLCEQPCEAEDVMIDYAVYKEG